MLPDMGQQGIVGDRLRERLRAERERRGWSQAEVAKILLENYPGMYGGTHRTTIAKIEAGERAVHVMELHAFANLFQTTVDDLMGRSQDRNDLVLAMSKLTSVAHRSAGEVKALSEHIKYELEDVKYHAEPKFATISARGIIEQAQTALNALHAARVTLNELADQFPPVGSRK